MKRKQFLTSCGLACTGTLLAPYLLSSCKSTAYLPHSIQGDRVVIRKKDLGDRDINLIKMEKLAHPVCIVQSGGNYTALLMLCTHKDCEVVPSGPVFHCPCHGSEFDRRGEVVQGPAQKPLQQFKVSHDAENIYIY